MRERQPGTCSVRIAAAASPSMPGISMSRSATSGAVAFAAATTSSPLPTEATTVKSSSQVEQRGQGGADELLVVGEEEPDRHADAPAARWTASRHPLGCVGPASMIASGGGDPFCRAR